ncbi:epoxyqueuosine reductase QueG [Desulfitispora alkaliphila]
MDLNERIKELALQNGVTYFGVADLSKAKQAILSQGGLEIASFPYSISLGIPLTNHIVDQLPRRSERSVALNYSHHGTDVINQRLDIVASVVSGFIQQQGHTVLPIPASKRIDDERICAAFSHKMGASLSGLGWIGKSCLLITPDSGPRVRWASILTDAPIEPTGQLMEEQCGDCSACVDICPMKTFTGKPFHEEEPREVRYDAKKCDKYFEKMKAKGQIDVCGMCLYVCPYGRK